MPGCSVYLGMPASYQLGGKCPPESAGTSGLQQHYVVPDGHVTWHRDLPPNPESRSMMLGHGAQDTRIIREVILCVIDHDAPVQWCHQRHADIGAQRQRPSQPLIFDIACGVGLNQDVRPESPRVDGSTKMLGYPAYRCRRQHTDRALIKVRNVCLWNHGHGESEPAT